MRVAWCIPSGSLPSPAPELRHILQTMVQNSLLDEKLLRFQRQAASAST